MMETKRKPMLTQLYDHTGFERQLEQMARKGWKLEQCGGFLGWKFRRIEPMELQYKVVYFPEASEFDPAPGDRQAEFIELCEQSGWEYIDHSAQMLIFCSRVPDPMPIETDAMVQVETIHKAMKKTYLPGQIMLLGLAAFVLVMMTYQLHTSLMNVLISDALLVSYTAYLLMTALSVHHLGEYYLWRRKALDAAADGVFVETRGKNLFEKLVLLAVAGVFLLWLWSMSDDKHLMGVAGMTVAIIFIGTAIGNGAKLLMQKMNVSKGTNEAVTVTLIAVVSALAMTGVQLFVINSSDVPADDYVGTYEFAGMTHYVYDDPIPLTLEMLGIEADYKHRSRVEEITGSLLVTVYNAQEVAPWGSSVDEPNELYYTVTVPKLRFLMEPVTEAVLEDKRVINLYGMPTPVDPSLWKAERVYEHIYAGEPSGYYTVVYSDRIVEINFPYVPTAEQVQLGAKVLRDLEIE